MRELRVEDEQVAVASIELLKISKNVWGYLRFKIGSTTTRKYIGKVTAESREESLQLGWSLVRKKKIVEKFGWRWVHRA